MSGRRLDPIALQVMLGAFRSVCEEMGAVLIRSAHSPNIKERRDCSTALFDPGGELVMQAEHIPVHLGSMPDSVAAVIGEPQRPGTEWILNDPFAGGTHLPDITVITPLFDPGGELLAFAASRAHHADVGGPTPGGMPVDSEHLADEGVVIGPTRIAGDTLTGLAGRMRHPRQRLADLRAQLAANRVARERLAELGERHGQDRLRTAMEAILDYSERRARHLIGAIGDGTATAHDHLEPAGADPVELSVTVTVAGPELRIELAAPAALRGNLNCPAAVTRSAVLFAVKALTDPDGPPSAGANRAVEITIPAGSMLDAPPGSAVAAGNVETSSRVADLVITALGRLTGGPAQGQGTMNNLTLSGRGFTYYETIGGGGGACADSDGASAIHVAMSNTLNTPVEALEAELPIRVRELGLRRGSGGAGRHRGGDGIVREIEALAPIAFTLITERRLFAPAGAGGGKPGKTGHNRLNGNDLPAKCAGNLDPGDILRIETPGGGGWGEPG